MRVWIDTDVGTNPDDALALLLAVAHPGVELVGVSTVSGDVAARESVARRVLGPDASGLPVVPGSEGLAAAITAVAPDAVCGIGPATNLSGLAVAAVLPDAVALMGGVLAPVEHRGALRRVDTNVGADPTAAATLLELRPDAVLVPLDVTVRTQVGAADRARLDAAVGTRVVPPLASFPHALCLHDPLTLLSLLEEPVETVEARRLRVRPDGSIRMGEGPSRPVVVDVDPRAAVERVVGSLGG